MLTNSRKVLVFTWLLSLSATLMALLSADAHANGRVVDFIRQIAGPYEIAVGTIPAPPVVGSLHLTMNISDVTGDAPTLVPDADVTVTGVGPSADSSPIGPLTATRSPTEIGFYDVNATVNKIGFWTFTVEVDSDLGAASSDFVIEVKTSNPFFRVFTWVTVVVFLAVIGLGVIPFIRQRARRKRAR